MRIGFTGTQRGMTHYQRELIPQILELKGCTEFVFGDCIGADDEAAEIAFESGIEIFTIFPPSSSPKRAWKFNPDKDISREGKGWQVINYKGKTIKVRWMPADTYLNRNKHIVDNVDWMIGAPKEHRHTLRSGTWSTIRYCWKGKKREITVIPPIDRTIDNGD